MRLTDETKSICLEAADRYEIKMPYLTISVELSALAGGPVRQLHPMQQATHWRSYRHYSSATIL